MSAVIAALLLLTTFGCVPPSQKPPPDPNTLTIEFLDVGQADAALLVCGGEAALIDGGNAADSSKIYSALKSRGITHLRYIINSHSDEDHVGGLAGALNAATVDICLAPSAERNTITFNNFKKYLTEQGLSITVPKVGDSFALGSATLEIVGPTKNWNNVNDNSLVILVKHGQEKILFTGDISAKVENDLTNNQSIHDVDLLKIAHHGSDSSTSYQFLYYTNPKNAVICVGDGNKYHHPIETVLSRLKDLGASLYRTDLHGDITAVSDGATITITTAKTAQKDIYTPGK